MSLKIYANVPLYFRTGVGSSGSRQELFYAEIDETMKVSEGGGVDSEKIEKVSSTFTIIPFNDQKTNFPLVLTSRMLVHEDISYKVAEECSYKFFETNNYSIKTFVWKFRTQLVPCSVYCSEAGTVLLFQPFLCFLE